MCRLVWAFAGWTYLYHIVGNLLSRLNCCIGCKASKLTYCICSQIVQSGVCLWLTALTICITNGLFFLAWNKIRNAAFWSRKIHVQIMRFTCCLNMAFTWKSLNLALICMHYVTLECVVAVIDHFTDAYVCENVARDIWRCGDVMPFESWRGRQFVLRNQA